MGVGEAELSVTESKVAVPSFVVECEVTASPASTVPLTSKAAAEPASALQLTPSAEVDALTFEPARSTRR